MTWARAKAFECQQVKHVCSLYHTVIRDAVSSRHYHAVYHVYVSYL